MGFLVLFCIYFWATVKEQNHWRTNNYKANIIKDYCFLIKYKIFHSSTFKLKTLFIKTTLTIFNKQTKNWVVMVREQRRQREKSWCGGRVQELGFNFYELVYYEGRRLNRVIISESALMDSGGFLGNSGRVRNRNKLAGLGALELRSKQSTQSYLFSIWMFVISIERRFLLLKMFETIVLKWSVPYGLNIQKENI